MDQAGDKQSPTLFEFIEANHRLLATVGIFAALTIFAAGLARKGLATVLSLCFLSATVLLWLELMARFPRKIEGWRLNLFRQTLTFATLVLVFHWAVEFQQLWPGGFAFIVLFLITPLLMRVPSVLVERSPTLKRQYGALLDRPIGRVVNGGVFALLLVLAIAIAFAVTPGINKAIDALRKGL